MQERKKKGLGKTIGLWDQDPSDDDSVALFVIGQPDAIDRTHTQKNNATDTRCLSFERGSDAVLITREVLTTSNVHYWSILIERGISMMSARRLE